MPRFETTPPETEACWFPRRGRRGGATARHSLALTDANHLRSVVQWFGIPEFGYGCLEYTKH